MFIVSEPLRAEIHILGREKFPLPQFDWSLMSLPQILVSVGPLVSTELSEEILFIGCHLLWRVQTSVSGCYVRITTWTVLSVEDVFRGRTGVRVAELGQFWAESAQIRSFRRLIPCEKASVITMNIRVSSCSVVLIMRCVRYVLLSLREEVRAIIRSRIRPWPRVCTHISLFFKNK